MTKEKLEQLSELAREAALVAGEAIMEIYNSNDFGVEQKDNASPLTLADKAGHEVITRMLISTGLPILSEEGKDIPFDERKNWEYYWLIDPLDGTKEFIKRNGEFTVNIALIHHGEPVLGVVYAPVLERLYWASRDNGAFLKVGNNPAESISVDKESPISSIVASRSHMSTETSDFISKFPDATMVSMGSSLKFLLVAEGKAHIYPRFAPTMEWDTAAAQAIVEIAGGTVLNYPELTPLKYNREDMLNGWFLCSR